MAYTTIPAWVITAGLLLWLLPAVGAGDLGGTADASRAARRHRAGACLFAAAFCLAGAAGRAQDECDCGDDGHHCAGAGAHLSAQPPDLAQLGSWFYGGFKLDGSFENIRRLVSRGGIESMFFTQTIVILGLSLGGLLFALGIIPSLLEGMRRFLTNAGRATFSVAATAVGVNVLIGEQYLSILLSGETFKPVYHETRPAPAKPLAHAGRCRTVINPLVPWSVCGVFISQVLGVPVWDYLPYAFFCYLCLILTLLFCARAG